MTTYDWTAIMLNKTDKELKLILKYKSSEPKIKVLAAVKELEKRGLIKENVILKIEDQYKPVTIGADAPSLYSDKLIYRFSIFFSVLFGGILFAINLKQVDKEKGIIPVIIFSITYTLLGVYILEILHLNSFGKLVVNAIGGLIINHLFWSIYIGKGLEYKRRSYKKPLLIALIIFIPLFVLTIWSRIF